MERFDKEETSIANGFAELKKLYELRNKKVGEIMNADMGKSNLFSNQEIVV